MFPCVPFVCCVLLYPLLPFFFLCPLDPFCLLCPLVSFVSRFPCFLCVPCDFCLTFVPGVPLSPLYCLCSPCPPVFCVPFFHSKNTTFSVALPLFILWRENFDGFHSFHMTTCGFFCTLRMSKDVIFIKLEKQNTKFCFTCLENWFYFDYSTNGSLIYLFEPLQTQQLFLSINKHINRSFIK